MARQGELSALCPQTLQGRIRGHTLLAAAPAPLRVSQDPPSSFLTFLTSPLTQEQKAKPELLPDIWTKNSERLPRESQTRLPAHPTPMRYQHRRDSKESKAAL